MLGVVISARGPCCGGKLDEGRRFLAFGRVRCAVLQSPDLCFQTRLLSIHGLGRPVGGEGAGLMLNPVVLPGGSAFWDPGHAPVSALRYSGLLGSRCPVGGLASGALPVEATGAA